MITVETVVGLWMFSFALFHMNPLNDPLRPDSKMNPSHPDNILIEERMLKENSKDEIVLRWPDVAPYVNATVASLSTFALGQILRWII